MTKLDKNIDCKLGRRHSSLPAACRRVIATKLQTGSLECANSLLAL